MDARVKVRQYFEAVGGSDLRAPILNAALSLYIALGPGKATTREIARRAQTSETNVFRIFSGGKDALFNAVYSACWSSIVDRLTLASFETGLTGSPEEQIEADFDTLFDMYEDDVQRDILMFAFLYMRRPERVGAGADDPPPLSTLRKRLISLCRGVTKGRAPYPLEPEKLAELLLNYAVVVVSSWYFGPREGLPAGLDRVQVRLVLRTLIRNPIPPDADVSAA